MSTSAHGARWDAPFWAVLLVSAVSLGSLSFFGFAASQKQPADVAIISTDNIPPPAEL